MDGNLTKEELKKAVEMATEGCKQIYKLQRDALIERYKKDLEEHKEEVELVEVIAESEETSIESTIDNTDEFGGLNDE
ncbi:MAG: hypothetical protein KFBDDELM_00099 [Candidatus Argoarchaeum ethanivorans]|uniref:Uncharacterized protein n=1 Tax=Candidatus Argoarchaeum ethanivorans TaxID=2608793 RepID=A0A811T489_9EURY|nr:MAG: hypothetical protein KFBDDELM_00099 [Candidatus Argoarchaeum ethanivorans]